MQKYLELISNFLQKEESCFLPGIGVLKCEHLPAIEKEGEIVPPSSKIQLDHSGKEAQHSIIKEIKDRFHLSEQEAQKEWEKVTDIIKKQSKPLSIPGMGLLKKNKEGVIHFLAFKSHALYRAIPLPDKIQQPEKDEPYIFEDEAASGNKKWYIWIPIIILAAGALGYFGYRYLFSPPSKTIQNDPAVTPVESTGPPFSSTPTTDSVKARKAALQKAETTDSIHFAVIYKVYHSRQSAEKHYKRMRNWGHDVSIYTPDSTTFMLGYPFYALPADTAPKLEEIQDTYGGAPFIIYPEK